MNVAAQSVELGDNDRRLVLARDFEGSSHLRAAFKRIGALARLHLLERLGERRGGLAVHDHLELGGELHRKVARFLAAQDAIDISGSATKDVYSVTLLCGT